MLWYIFDHVPTFEFICLNFLFMFKFLGHIHSVILNGPSDYSSFNSPQLKFFYFCFLLVNYHLIVPLEEITVIVELLRAWWILLDNSIIQIPSIICSNFLISLRSWTNLILMNKVLNWRKKVLKCYVRKKSKQSGLCKYLLSKLEIRKNGLSRRK